VNRNVLNSFLNESTELTVVSSDAGGQTVPCICSHHTENRSPIVQSHSR